MNPRDVESGNRNRARIVRAVADRGEVCVTELARMLDLSPSTVAYHIHRLERSRALVTAIGETVTRTGLKPAILVRLARGIPTEQGA